MDKLLDLFLATPLAKRYAAGFAERGLIFLLGAIGVWLKLDPASYQSDVAKFAAEAAPYVAAAALFVLAQKRMKKAEVTIETSRVLPGDTPRSLVDATVQTLLKRRQAPTSEAAATVAVGHAIAGPEGQLAKAQAAAALNNPNPLLELLQKVPPGTVDRTD